MIKRPPGPLGLGDPDDKTLSKNEINCIIRQIKSRIIREEKCKDLSIGYFDCMCKEGVLKSPIKCKQEKLDLNECLELWDQNEEIWSRAKKHYIKVRSEYRRTGIAQYNEDTVNGVLLNPPPPRGPSL